MADVSISIGSSLATNLFSSLQYPWRKKLDGDRRQSDDGNIDFDVLEPTDDTDLTVDEPAYVDAMIDAYLDNAGTPTREGSTEQAISDLIKPYISNTAGTRDEARQAIKNAMENDSDFAGRLYSVLGVSWKTKVDWIEFELSKAPGSHLGNPMALTDLKIAARAKIESCVSAWGWHGCLRMTTEWFRFEGRKAQVELGVYGLQIKAKASTSDIDFIIKIKIWKFSTKIRIGITKYVNKYLAKMHPVVLDLGAIRVKVPGLSVTYAPTTLAAPGSATDTVVAVEGQFSA